MFKNFLCSLFQDPRIIAMKRIFSVSTSALLMMFAAAWVTTCEAKEPAHFVPANVSKAGNIPYPASSLDAGVVTLSVDLDETGQVTGVAILRDIPSVSGPAAAAVRSWTYGAATLDGKNDALRTGAAIVSHAVRPAGESNRSVTAITSVPRRCAYFAICKI